MSSSQLVACAFGFSAIVSTGTAFGAACCGDGGSLGQRLGRFESAALTFGPSYTERFGGYGPRRDYHALARGDQDRALRLDVSWLVRVTSRIELGMAVPVQVSFRSLGGAHDTGGGVGDVMALARFTVIPVSDETPWPAVFTTMSLVVPTGRPTWLGSTLGANVTGQGVPELRPSIGLEKSWHERWFAQVNGSVGLFGLADAGGLAVARPPRWSIAGATGPVFTVDRLRSLAFGAGLVYEAEGAPTLGGIRGSSGRARLDLLASGALDITKRISLLASIRTALPASELGENDVASTQATVAGRFAFHLFD